MAPKLALTTSKAPTSITSKAPAKLTKGSKAAKKTSSKAAHKCGNKKKCCKVCKKTYSSYIYKMLKHVHVVPSDTGISKKVIIILNLFVNDSFKCIAIEASKFSTYSKKSTISSQEIQTTICLILHGECLNFEACHF